ncbi:MAG: cysteine desulfurase [Proteobacteria bacterium]|nr:cysteine desulfurase [Pseudomonadota bacterium]
MIQKLTYLDHNATTPLRPAVLDVMRPLLEFSGNASSIHRTGREARRCIEDARRQIARFVHAGPAAVIIFTAGATEANNQVLRGSGCERVLVAATEHSSVLKARPEAEVIPVLASGVVDLAALDRMLEGNDRPTLISVMLVNNETGIIQPLDKIVEIAKRRGALVHTDAAQAAGRLPLDLQKPGVDYLTLSAHKMGGPQGMGCLVLSNCAPVTPLLRGGDQEKNLRAGTENIAGIAGFGAAAAAANVAEFQKLEALRDRLEAGLKKIAPALRFFGQDVARVANTTMFSLAGLSSETQLIALDMAGICVSNGSACASGTVKPSHVLKAMGVSDAEAASSLRVSLGWNSTETDVEYFLRQWGEMYNRIRSRLDAA